MSCFTVEQVRGAMVRIATLMAKVPMEVVQEHLSEAEWKELEDAYVKAGELVPSDYADPNKRRKVA